MQGLLLLNKPKGITSFSAAHKAGRILGEKRVGHTGTLDPMASGVLPLLVGRATALSDYLLTADKGYTATVKLGITTDTLDITGTVLSEGAVNVSESELNSALTHFTGKQSQIPPMYSAIKKNGVPMYALARKGQTVELEPRDITVFNINLISPLADNCFTIDVKCSKGTYIRSLCRDIGEFLGCGATLTELTRTKTAGFDLSECVTLEELEKQGEALLLPTEKAVKQFDTVYVSYKQAVRASNGGALSLDRLNKHLDDRQTVLIKNGDSLIALGVADKEASLLKIKCVLIEPMRIN